MDSARKDSPQFKAGDEDKVWVLLHWAYFKALTMNPLSGNVFVKMEELLKEAGVDFTKIQ